MSIILNLVLIIVLLPIVHIIFLRPNILTWGATKQEADMPLPGDELAPFISATRAITIDAPINEVWQWLIQLGADRGGFFSYAFIEKILGYEFQETESISQPQDMQMGRIIPASIDESKSAIKLNFPVVAVEPGKYYVLGGWGPFVLKELNPTKTRLIVRTHGQETHNIPGKISDFLGEMGHYIMERRMMMGFKAAAEKRPIPAWVDNLWLLGLVLSACGIAGMVLMGAGIPGILLSTFYAIIWLWVFLIPAPRPQYSNLLMLVVAISIVWIY
ncbi:MAG: hypothetical protein JW908_07870 [Anaerolineales bacterium]|nr:hypothetical protein [Anaerolineales bacterium]